MAQNFTKEIVQRIFYMISNTPRRIPNIVYDIADRILRVKTTLLAVGEIWYPQSASNTRVVGAAIAAINQQLSPAYSWCVGHSLGAHACGHAGKRGANFDRITGKKYSSGVSRLSWISH